MKYIYAYYSENANFYMKPDINQLPPEEALTDFRRSMAMSAEQFAKTGIHNCSLYFLGTFDDEKGIFDQSQKMKLMDAKDIEALLSRCLNVGTEEVNQDGRAEPTAGN